MINLIKFKALKKDDLLYFQAGYVTNRHWLFSIEWLNGLKRTRASGLISLFNRITKARIKAVSDRLNDKGVHNLPIEKLISDINLSEYAPLDIFKNETLTGYFRGYRENKTSVGMSFIQNGTPFIDIEYSPALFFDPSASVLFNTKNANGPLVIQNRAGSIVGLLMPLKRENFIKTENKGN